MLCKPISCLIYFHIFMYIYLLTLLHVLEVVLFVVISTLYFPEKCSEHLSFTSKKTGNVYEIATCTNKIKNDKIEV